MKKIVMVVMALLITGSVWADLIDKNQAYSVSIRKFILNDTSAARLSLTAGILTKPNDIVYLTFSSENAATAVVGYGNGTPVAYIPIKEDTSIKLGPYNGYFGVICSTCSAAAGVTVTVDVY